MFLVGRNGCDRNAIAHWFSALKRWFGPIISRDYSMPKVRIVVALSKRLTSELCDRMQTLPGARVVKKIKKKKRIEKQQALFRAVRKEMEREPQEADDRVVVLTCLDDHGDAAPLCTGLLDEFSELIVYDIGEHIATRYRKPTLRARMTIDEVLADLSSMARPRKRRDVVPFESSELDRG
jgi:hypothetical protein